ncbi:DUF3789 domain-containing protein [Ruminococcus bicirculans (ex Wegman et al. 2014)]|uniref:DUF3789 domain-containing protein n=1 Tax=Ruminococcus bicirculans (ex Wegman et al. 2014) TaxID=1160721 RepID=UPI00399A5C03
MQRICVVKRRSIGGIALLGFIIGLIIGGTVGVFAMALCIAAGQADKRENCTDSDK